jgi:hypothetical protein
MLSSTRLSTDPAKHATALVQNLGMPAAWQLVQHYAKDCPMGTYWPRALAALRQQQRDLRRAPQRRAAGKHANTAA